MVRTGGTLAAVMLGMATAGAAEAPAVEGTRFLSVDGAFDGAYVSSGLDARPGGRDLVLRFTGGSGVSRYRIDPTLPDRVAELTGALRLMAGWRLSGSWGLATVFAGVATETRRLSPAFPDPSIGTRAGPAIALDAWLKPGERLAVQVFATYATPFQAASLRLAPGYDIGEGLHLGPEFAISAHHGTVRTRLGVHATGLTFGPLGVRVSGGLATDRGGRSGAYGAIGLWRNY